MRAIFVSYRRGDTEGEAGRLFDDLISKFGENVFMDVAAIEAGRDFRKVIDENVSTCGVLLAIVGKNWVDAKDENGNRRLDNPMDFVRLEIASALRRDIPVVPVLVGGAKMPRPEDLPEDLRDLAYRNYVELTHARWGSDLQPLLEALRRQLKVQKSGPSAPTGPSPEPEVATSPILQPECAGRGERMPASAPFFLASAWSAIKKIGEIAVSLGKPSGPAPASNPAEVPRDLPVDNVHFTLTGPLVLAPGRAHELQFWLHVEQQRSAVLKAASMLHGLPQSNLAVKSEGPYPLRRGSRISVGLMIEGLKCLDSHKWITWTGEIGNTTFVIEVPPDASREAYRGRASIRLDGCEIARTSFLVRVGAANLKIDEIPSQTRSHRSAFASYASEDRAEVLSRVQGMEAAYNGLDVFVDVIDLRSGQNWERELEDRISKADVFYLFWCCHALKSEWVGKEWRWALAAKGQDFIDPVPLQGPGLAPPPSELAAKHFNDPLLAFIAAAGGVHSV
jgi:hypothetical protein